jgi:ubiquinone/menaquinone biosynthesis C-methylase UbiE
VHPQDHFSSVSHQYATSRPTYPHALFQWLATVAPAHERAWDCACGSGQASGDLAERFSHVVATDLSAQQLAEAPRHPRVEYHVAVAESSGLPAASFDLVTVAQALHWFEHERFYAEVRRVLRPGGVLAAWCYGKGVVDHPAVDAVLQDFYHEVVGPYWKPERKLVEEGYRSLPFPQPELAVPDLSMALDWSLEALIGYTRSWSATALYIKTLGSDPVPALAGRLRAVWGDPAVLRHRIRWPLSIRASSYGVSH